MSLADYFTVGGNWTEDENGFVLSDPRSPKQPGTNGNLAITGDPQRGDYTLGITVHSTGTSKGTNDFSVIFGYAGLRDYYFASFGETNDSLTQGVFKVTDGVPTQLIDFEGQIVPFRDYRVEVRRINTSAYVLLNGKLLASLPKVSGAPVQLGLGSQDDGARFADWTLAMTATSPAAVTLPTTTTAPKVLKDTVPKAPVSTVRKTKPAPSSPPVSSSVPDRVSPPSNVRRLHISPSGAGNGDGSSWANAGQLGDVDKFIAKLSAGGEIWLQADAGPYQASTVTIRGGGASPQKPVVLRGVTSKGEPASALLVGNRTAPYRPNGRTGAEVFKLYGGTKNLVFRDIAFRNQGSAFVAAGDVSNITVTDVTATNVRRFFENYRSSKEPSANINGLVIKRVRVDGFSKTVVRFQYNSSNLLMEDVIADSQRQDGDNFAMGIHIDDTAHNVTLRRVSIANTHSSKGSYWNGDGFATERGNYNITFEDTNATGATDGGYDLKSSNTKLIRTKASDNKRNYRFWGRNMVVTDCFGGTHRRRGGTGGDQQIWAAPQAVVTMTGCSFTDLATEVEHGGKVTVNGKLLPTR